MKLLPLLALTGCLQVRGDIPNTCPEQEKLVEQSCREASVIGENDNEKLNSSIDDLRECLNLELKVICSDPGLGEPKILTYKIK